MADAVVQVAPDSTGHKIDVTDLTVGANTVARQRINVADPSTAAALAAVKNANPASGDYGVVVREANLGQQSKAGSSSVAFASDEGAASTARLTSSAASNNAISVKASAGRVFGVQGYNASGAPRRLKLYDKAGAPAPATDAPRKVLLLPAGAAFAYDFPAGLYFATGIAYAIVAGGGDTDNTSVAAGDVTDLNIDYT